MHHELAPGAAPTGGSATDARTTGTSPHAVFPIIGLGASAGGLQALHQFFDAMPPDSGMAFVVILHLSPDHESHAAHILQQSTAMPVQQVTALESASHYPKVNPHNKQYMFPYPASARLPDT